MLKFRYVTYSNFWPMAKRYEGMTKRGYQIEKITFDNFYKILVNFNRLYTVLSDIDKKRLLNEFMEEVQIYDEKALKSTWVKSVVF